MPDGKVHSSITTGLAIGLTVGYVSAQALNIDNAWMIPIGTMSGVMIGPDWDVDGGNRSNLYVRSFLGGFFGWIYMAWKLPYSLAMKHRSFWSHFPIVSTLIRLLYIFCPPIILIFRDQDTSLLKLTLYSFGALFFSLPYLFAMGAVYAYGVDLIPYLVPFIFGLMLSDIFHWAADELL